MVPNFLGFLAAAIVTYAASEQIKKERKGKQEKPKIKKIEMNTHKIKKKNN